MSLDNTGLNRSADGGPEKSKLTERVAASVTDCMDEAVTELAYERREDVSTIVREALVEYCEDAPEICTVTESDEHIRLMDPEESHE